MCRYIYVDFFFLSVAFCFFFSTVIFISFTKIDRASCHAAANGTHTHALGLARIHSLAAERACEREQITTISFRCSVLRKWVGCSANESERRIVHETLVTPREATTITHTICVSLELESYVYEWFASHRFNAAQRYWHIVRKPLHCVGRIANVYRRSNRFFSLSWTDVRSRFCTWCATNAFGFVFNAYPTPSERE